MMGKSMREPTILSIQSERLLLGASQMFCVMAYPSDTGRAGLLLKELVKSGTDQLSEKALKTVKVMRLERFLWQGLGEPGRSTIRDAGVKQFAKGRVAGQVLLYALRCGAHRPEHRSVSKAIFLVSACAERSSEKTQLPTSESKVTSYWKEFQAVAHLHASQLVVEAQGQNWWEAEEAEELASRFFLFLAIAERISRAAHAQIPPVGRGPRKLMHAMEDG